MQLLLLPESKKWLIPLDGFVFSRLLFLGFHLVDESKELELV
jgi:hypothetical protein